MHQMPAILTLFNCNCISNIYFCRSLDLYLHAHNFYQKLLFNNIEKIY